MLIYGKKKNSPENVDVKIEYEIPDDRIREMKAYQESTEQVFLKLLVDIFLRRTPNNNKIQTIEIIGFNLCIGASVPHIETKAPISENKNTNNIDILKYL